MAKKIIWFLVFITNIPLSHAVDGGMLWNSVADKLRNWNIWLSDIPNAIQGAINFFIGLAWWIAVIFIIIWAYKILFWSIEQDKTKWKDTVLMSIWGFIIASLAWFIVKFIFDNFW